MDLADVIIQVEKTGKEMFIPCPSWKAQASMRARLFKLRKKIYKDSSSVGISNYTSGEELFVKVYKKANLTIYTMGEDGNLVPIENKVKLIDLVANARQVELMRADGYSDEEIEEALEGGAND